MANHTMKNHLLCVGILDEYLSMDGIGQPDPIYQQTVRISGTRIPQINDSAFGQRRWQRVNSREELNRC